MHRWPFQMKLNPDCTKDHKKKEVLLHEILSQHLLFLFQEAQYQWLNNLYKWSLCLASPGSETAISQSRYLNLLSNWPTRPRLDWNQPRCKVLETASVDTICLVKYKVDTEWQGVCRVDFSLLSSIPLCFSTLSFVWSPRCLYNQHEMLGFER